MRIVRISRAICHNVSSTTGDPDDANNTATVTTTVIPVSKLSVTKSDAPDPVMVGQNLTYTITVRNTGFMPAPLVVLGDVVPTDTTFVAFTAPAGWTAVTPPVGDTGSVTATIPALPAMTSAVFVLVVKVNPSVPDGTTLTNTATVSGGDPLSGTDSDTETTLVVRETPPAPVPALSLLGIAIALMLLLGIAMRRLRSGAG
jgi:uncharacterized repeat protein (TIGR01451 family)